MKIENRTNVNVCVLVVFFFLWMEDFKMNQILACKARNEIVEMRVLNKHKRLYLAAISMNVSKN